MTRARSIPEFIADLRCAFPVSKPVRVELVAGLRYHAVVTERRKTYLLQVRDEDGQHMKDSLMHEWAHMLAGLPFVGQRGEGHTNSWGIWYARIYRVMVDEYGTASIASVSD